MQHTAGEALLKMGSVVADLLPLAGEALLNTGSMLAETQHKAGRSPLTSSPVVGKKGMLVF